MALTCAINWSSSRSSEEWFLQMPVVSNVPTLSGDLRHVLPDCDFQYGKGQWSGPASGPDLPLEMPYSASHLLGAFQATTPPSIGCFSRIQPTKYIQNSVLWHHHIPRRRSILSPGPAICFVSPQLSTSRRLTCLPSHFGHLNTLYTKELLLRVVLPVLAERPKLHLRLLVTEVVLDCAF